MHVLQPSGEFHIIDGQVDADLGELALKLVAEFGTIRVGIGEGELQRLVGGVSDFAQQFLGLGWIVRVQAGQVLVARIDGWDRTAERLVDVAAGRDDLLVIDGVADRLAHALVFQLRIGAVEGEHELVASGCRGDLILRLVEPLGECGVHRREHIHVTALERVNCGVVVGEEADDHLVGLRLMRGAPVLRIGLEHDLVARVEGFDGVRSGTNGLGLRVVLGVLVKHQSRTSGEVPQQVRIRFGKGHLHGVGVDRLDLADTFDGVRIQILFLDKLVDGPHHVGRIKLVAVGEVHLVIEMERIGLTVLGNVPGFGDVWLDLIVRIARHQSLVDVAVEDLFERGSGLLANVKADRGKFQPHSNGVGFGRCSVRVVGFTMVLENGNTNDDGDDRNDGDKHIDPLLRALRFW